MWGTAGRRRKTVPLRIVPEIGQKSGKSPAPSAFRNAFQHDESRSHVAYAVEDPGVSLRNPIAFHAAGDNGKLLSQARILASESPSNKLPNRTTKHAGIVVDAFADALFDARGAVRIVLNDADDAPTE